MKRFTNLYKNRPGSSNASNTGSNTGDDDGGKTNSGKKIDVIMHNSGTLLAMLKDGSEIAGELPYVKSIAGVLELIIKMKEVRYTPASHTILTIPKELDDCKESWETTWKYVTEIGQILHQFRAEYSGGQPLTKHVEEACRTLEECLKDFLGSLQRYQKHGSVARLIRRQALREEAEKCSEQVSRALELFRVSDLQDNMAYPC
jgi:hypothetical protein